MVNLKPFAAGSLPLSEERLRLVVVGHVDHGKSTLIGRLLYDTGSLLEGKYEQLVAIAERRGVPFEFANLTDAFQAERNQNITIDTAQIRFRSGRREYVLIDAPGHKEFVKNMVTGAASADAALIIIDAQEGVREQSRRHGYLLRLLGIDQVAVAVNKMDLVGYSQQVFDAVAEEYSAFLDSIGVTARAIVPVSARLGDNVAAPSANMPWFSGGAVVDVLDGFAVPTTDAARPLRLPIQGVYKFDHRRILAGRIESGTIRVGDRLLFSPSGKQSSVKTIERWNEPACTTAIVGDSVGVTLTDQLFVERGEVISTLSEAPSRTSRFTARVFWLGKRPLAVNRPYKFKLATQEFQGVLVSVDKVIDAATVQPPAEAVPGEIAANQVGEVTVRTVRPIVVDPYDRVWRTGRFVVVDDMDVCGGGIIVDAGEEADLMAAVSPHITRSTSQVSRAERHRLNQHKGAVVWLTGLSGSGKSTLATALERALVDRRRQAFVLDGDNVRFGLSADLGFSSDDRSENIRRVAEVAKLFAEAGLIAITAFISPSRADRVRARRIVQGESGDLPFLEVFLSTPLDVCEARDPKKLYARARTGEIKEFTGISAPFEPPDHPEVVIDTAVVSVDDALATLLAQVGGRVELEGQA